MPRLRRLDHLAIWSQVVAILGIAIWYLSVRSDFSIGDIPPLLLLLLLSLVGFVAGVAAIFTRKSGFPWWPALVGILPGLALIAYFVLLLRIVGSNPCGFTYC